MKRLVLGALASLAIFGAASRTRRIDGLSSIRTMTGFLAFTLAPRYLLRDSALPVPRVISPRWGTVSIR
jgi:hypothetical protein